eukprot:GHVT01076720.1.p1 GENE.GHVT01076720.1~~GHVT01076720.1.p1  ORF type:complete len:399 (-),score=49.70 GHVT01076720.1:93-1289(-)
MATVCSFKSLVHLLTLAQFVITFGVIIGSPCSCMSTATSPRTVMTHVFLFGRPAQKKAMLFDVADDSATRIGVGSPQLAAGGELPLQGRQCQYCHHANGKFDVAHKAAAAPLRDLQLLAAARLEEQPYRRRTHSNWLAAPSLHSRKQMSIAHGFHPLRFAPLVKHLAAVHNSGLRFRKWAAGFCLQATWESERKRRRWRSYINVSRLHSSSFVDDSQSCCFQLRALPCGTTAARRSRALRARRSANDSSDGRSTLSQSPAEFTNDSSYGVAPGETDDVDRHDADPRYPPQLIDFDLDFTRDKGNCTAVLTIHIPSHETERAWQHVVRHSRERLSQLPERVVTADSPPAAVVAALGPKKMRCLAVHRLIAVALPLAAARAKLQIVGTPSLPTVRNYIQP